MSISNLHKLRIYNRALFHLGSRQLASLSEEREPRRVLDEIWGSSDEAVEFALSKASWGFGLRVVQWTLDESLETQFGWSYAFEKPTDYVRLEALSTDPRFLITLSGDRYAVENNYILTDYQLIYAKYVSNGNEFGFDSGLWTEPFIEYLGYYLAYHGAPRINGSFDEKEYLRKQMNRHLQNARSENTMEKGTRRLQSGNWARSRSGRGYSGTPSRLTEE